MAGNMRQWSVQQTAAFIASLGPSAVWQEYATSCARQFVDGPTLACANLSILKALGFPEHHGQVVLRAIENGVCVRHQREAIGSDVGGLYCALCKDRPPTQAPNLGQHQLDGLEQVLRDRDEQYLQLASQIQDYITGMEREIKQFARTQLASLEKRRREERLLLEEEIRKLMMLVDQNDVERVEAWKSAVRLEHLRFLHSASILNDRLSKLQLIEVAPEYEVHVQGSGLEEVAVGVPASFEVTLCNADASVMNQLSLKMEIQPVVPFTSTISQNGKTFLVEYTLAEDPKRPTFEVSVSCNVWTSSFSVRVINNHKWKVDHPWNVSSDDKHVFVTVYNDSKVAIIDQRPEGDVQYWGKKGTGEGQLNFPAGIVVDGEFVYIADRTKLQIFTKDGVFVRTAAQNLQNPYGLAQDKEQIYVANSEANEILVVPKKAGGQEATPKKYAVRQPCAVAVSEDYVVVLERGDKRISVLNKAGKPLGPLLNAQGQAHQVPNPSACSQLCIRGDHVLFGDHTGSDVMLWDLASRRPLEPIRAGLQGPTGVWVSNKGYFYVVERAQHAVHRRVWQLPTKKQ